MADFSNSSTLADWFDSLVNIVFFQPDDEKASQTFQEYVADDVVVKINHDQLGKAAYWGLIERARADGLMTADSNEEIKSWKAADGLGGGCVAQFGRFTVTNKTSGAQSNGSAVTLANVQLREGKRVLVELTEINS